MTQAVIATRYGWVALGVAGLAASLLVIIRGHRGEENARWLGTWLAVLAFLAAITQVGALFLPILRLAAASQP